MICDADTDGVRYEKDNKSTYGKCKSYISCFAIATTDEKGDPHADKGYCGSYREHIVY